MRDPYTVLGVARGTDDAEIKKAYRRLAKELHPDLHQGDAKVEERFKEVSAAYKLLGDKELRAKYDRGEIGPDGQQKAPFHYEYAGGGPRRPGAGPGPGGFSADDIFADIFSQFSGGRRARQPQRGADRQFELTVEFLDAALGGVRRVNLPAGKTLDVRIPAGIEDGKQIRLKGQGEPGPAGPGDALVEVRVRPHPLFKRDGNDVRIELPISLPEAVLGAKVKVPTIGGTVSLTVPKGAQSGQTMRLKGRGIAGGDQYVTLLVKLPDKADQDLEALMQRWQETGGYDPRSGDLYG
ncbi:MAG: J domain-containing protein [Alphaproteobacteria bacterium]